MHTDEDKITEQIIGAAFHVLNTLGVGFLEKVYENALVHVLRGAGLKTEQQRPISVHFSGVLVGEFFADILVNDRIIVELKAAKAISDEHQAQLLNYLKATGLRVGLILNFGTFKLGIKRMVL